MIEPAWHLQRLVFLVALVVVVAFAIWLAVTGHYKRLPGRPTT